MRFIHEPRTEGDTATRRRGAPSILLPAAVEGREDVVPEGFHLAGGEFIGCAGHQVQVGEALLFGLLDAIGAVLGGADETHVVADGG